MYFWLYCVLVVLHRLSLVVVSGGYSLVAASGPLNEVASLVVHGLSCSVTCGIFPNQRLNLCPLHWQANS